MHAGKQVALPLLCATEMDAEKQGCEICGCQVWWSNGPRYSTGTGGGTGIYALRFLHHVVAHMCVPSVTGGVVWGGCVRCWVLRVG